MYPSSSARLARPPILLLEKPSSFIKKKTISNKSVNSLPKRTSLAIWTAIHARDAEFLIPVNRRVARRSGLLTRMLGSWSRSSQAGGASDSSGWAVPGSYAPRGDNKAIYMGVTQGESPAHLGPEGQPRQ